jgi:hypothetical protein
VHHAARITHHKSYAPVSVHVVTCREGIEDVVLSKRRFTYEQEIAQNPLNYDAWFDYVKLEESTGNHERIREVCSIWRGVI